MPRQKLTEEEKKSRVKQRKQRDRTRYQELRVNPEAWVERRKRNQEWMQKMRKQAKLLQQDPLALLADQETQAQMLERDDDGFDESVGIDDGECQLQPDVTGLAFFNRVSDAHDFGGDDDSEEELTVYG
jgi:hypothetical protein